MLMPFRDSAKGEVNEMLQKLLQGTMFTFYSPTEELSPRGLRSNLAFPVTLRENIAGVLQAHQSIVSKCLSLLIHRSKCIIFHIREAGSGLEELWQGRNPAATEASQQLIRQGRCMRLTRR